MDLELKDKNHYYIFNGIQPEYRKPELVNCEYCKYLYEELKNLYETISLRHYDVPDIDAFFYIGDIHSVRLKKYYQLHTLKSKKFDLYCFFGNYTTVINIGKYISERDVDTNSLKIILYTGGNWEEDKEKWYNKIDIQQFEHTIFYHDSSNFNQHLLEIHKLLKVVTDYISVFSKKKGEFKFEIPKEQMVCQELGSYVLYLDDSKITDFLEKKLNFLCGGYRLITLSEVLPEGAHDMVYDGFTYIPIIVSDRDLDEETMNTLVQTSFNCKYPLYFRPKKADGLYVVNAILSRPEISCNMIPINKYDGSFERPQILCHREITIDELEIPVWYYDELLTKMKKCKKNDEWRYNNNEREIVNKVIQKLYVKC